MEKTIKENFVNNNFNKLNINFFQEYEVIYTFPASGGEADIFKIKKENIIYILKLYRYGIEPPLDILDKIKNLSIRFPENLIRIFEQGYSDEHKRYYEILEEASFGNLKEYLKNKDINNELILEIIKQTSNALYTLSLEGILHLDLKPENILIRSDKPFDLILSDFGMASTFDNNFSKKMTNIKGTNTYWSPESSIGVATEKSDYWSLGIIIYELITGTHPFRSMNEKLRNYEMNIKEISLSDEIEDSYKDLIKGLLTKDPQKRWGKNEINRWIAGEKVDVHFEDKKNSNDISFKYDNKYFYNLNELTNYLYKKEDGKEILKKLFYRGHISNWLSRKGLVDEAMEIDDYRESTDVEAFNLFIKKYAPIFIPNSFDNFINNFKLNKKLKKSSWIFIGLLVFIISKPFIFLVLLLLRVYMKRNYKSKLYIEKSKNIINIFFNKLQNKINKEIINNKQTDNKNRKLEKIRKRELKKLNRKRKRWNIIKFTFVLGTISYFVSLNFTAFSHYLINEIPILKNFIFSVIIPTFHKLVYGAIKIFNEFF